jgi:DNA-binding CsgD family transcriptional regulator
MNTIFNAIQFIETSLLFAAFMFTLIMFIRTRDGLAGRTFMVILPVASLLFISYMYSINEQIQGAKDATIGWLSPFFALVVIILIMIAALAACYYVIRLIPGTKKNKRWGLIFAAILVGVLLITTGILVMYISKSDLTMAITNALWAFYPLCSIALFIEAISLAFSYKKITDEHDKKLARYFIISFLPQIVFSIFDFILLRDISFQTTHLSYATFSLLVFVDLSGYFFRSYNTGLNITVDSQKLKERYALSDREEEVAELLVKGMTNQLIGETLHISVNTVKSHIKKIYEKLGVSNRLQLMNLITGVKTNSK